MGYYMGKTKFAKNRLKLNVAGLFLAAVFCGALDFFLCIRCIPGLSIGAFISLIIGIYLLRKAIKGHQEDSNFKTL